MSAVLFDALQEALQQSLRPDRILFLGIGVLAGLVVGFLPGLGGTAAMSILLPFVYGMDPYNGVGLLLGIIAVTSTGDSFPAILLGIPGSAGSQATVMDGHPLAKKGEGARALGAGFLANMLGGLFGATCLLGLTFVARPLILAFASPELFMMVVLGLTTVALVSSSGTMAQGIIMGILGLLIGSIGSAPAAPIERFTFGADYLSDGLSIVILVIGLFAIPEMIQLMQKPDALHGPVQITGRLREGARDTLRHWRIVVSNSFLGVLTGIIPGIGGAVTDWMSYGFTKRFVKNNQNFGKGDVRGVIAPESANNAKDGGALLPTLIFGIPPSASMGVLLGGLILMGVQPGPEMITTNLPLLLSIVWGLALANVMGTGICLALARQVARITLGMPTRRLAGFLLVIITVTTFQTTRRWGDLIALMVLGVVGQWLASHKWPRVPILIGFILSVGAERYLTLSMGRYGFSWLQRPMVIAIGLVAIGIVFVGTNARKMDLEKMAVE